MPRLLGRLTALGVTQAKRRGYYADGGGLYLQITASGSKSWVFRFKERGRLREMGLGPLHTVGLAEARQRAHECRKARLDGRDPIEVRRGERLNATLEAARAITFKGCAERYIAAHRAGWRNAKHAAQWTATLERYVHPCFGALPVQAVDVSLVLKAVEPIWTKKPETATRVRGRIEAILDWASARGYRRGENPARWRGHLENLLPSRVKVRRVEHHPALPYGDIGRFIAGLREQEGVAARALEFAILTAARTGEVIGARWNEISTKDRVWTVPAERMKGSREHRVPLSGASLTILDEMATLRSSEFVFPGMKAARPLSNMSFLMLLRRMERRDLTAHGFRSTFRDWAAERTGFPAEVAEMALAHAVAGKVEAAYRRGDLFEKRRQLMESWATFCASGPQDGLVVPLRR